MEIPVFQTKSDFEGIINKKIAPDEIILNLGTEAGRNATAKKYEALVHMIARQWNGKLNLSYNDLLSVCYEGLAYAMNTYGKKNKKSKATDEAVKGYTFGQYAAYCIRNHITGWGVADSHLVHIPNSQQKKERDEKGHNTRNLSISGDKSVGHDDEGSKTMFDFMGSSTDVEDGINAEDRKRLWDDVWKILSKEFDEKTLDIWCSYWGAYDHKKLQNKEIAKKYNVANSNVTYYCQKVNQFIKKNKKILDMFTELYELLKESINDHDRDTSSRGRMVTSTENIYDED
jgi:DNA-directed RNA polymerase specialized sigma subunit